MLTIAKVAMLGCFIGLSVVQAQAIENRFSIGTRNQTQNAVTQPGGGVYQPTGGTNAPFTCKLTNCFCYSAADCFAMGSLGVCAGPITKTTGSVSECKKKGA